MSAHPDSATNNIMTTATTTTSPTTTTTTKPNPGPSAVTSPVTATSPSSSSSSAAAAERAMSHTAAWKPALDRRQSWSAQEYKHDLHQRQYMAGSGGGPDYGGEGPAKGGGVSGGKGGFTEV